METLKFTEQKNASKWKCKIEEVLVAVFFASGLFCCITDMFEVHITIEKQNWGSLGNGLIVTWNQIARIIGKKNYILLPQFEEQGQGNTLFLGLCFGLITCLFFLLLKARCSWIVPVIMIAVLGFGKIFRLKIQETTLLVFGVAVLFFLLYLCRGSEAFWKNVVFLFIVIGISVSIYQVPFVQQFAGKPELVQRISGVVKKEIQQIYYGENPLQNGNLKQRKRPEKVGTAFEIKMSDPQSMYLRGFVGEQCQKDGWKALSEQSYYEAKDLFYWLEQDGFCSIGQLGKANELISEEQKDNVISIKMKDADSRYAYIPYEIKSNVTNGKVWGGSFITPTKMRRLKNYEYLSGLPAVKSWTDIAAKIFIKSESTEDFTRYLIDESYYNKYVYEKNTYLSKEDRLLLKKYIGESGNQSRGHIDYKMAIEGIRKYLDEQFIYTENLGPKVEKNQSALEEFLVSKKGYDVQFATAATLMFRYYGIPARYVEGYLITPQDIEQIKSEENIQIPLQNAHAWTEIYIDGSGFVPIEVCSDYRELMGEADMTVGISNNTLLRPFENNSGGGNQKDTLEAGDDDQHTPFLYRILVIVIVSILLIFLLCRIGYKVIRKIGETWKRQRLFQKEACKVAVSAIYSYMESCGYPIKEEAKILGNKAAYSLMEITEEERQWMLREWKRAKRENRENEKKKRNCCKHSIGAPIYWWMQRRHIK